MKDHILIVEDDAALNQILGLHFEELGCTVSHAHTSAEALEEITRTACSKLFSHMPISRESTVFMLASLSDAGN